MLVMMYGWVTIEETLIPGVTAVWIQKSQNFGDLGKGPYFDYVSMWVPSWSEKLAKMLTQ